MITALSSYTDLMRISLLSIGLFSSLMALLILYILFSLLIDENSRSIALLKILGYEAAKSAPSCCASSTRPFCSDFSPASPFCSNFMAA